MAAAAEGTQKFPNEIFFSQLDLSEIEIFYFIPAWP